MYTSFFLSIWIWFGKKILGFTCVDVYSPNKEDVVGITFSTSEIYINKVEKIE